MTAAAHRELTAIRQTSAVQVALAAALAVLIAGREVLDLGRAPAQQLSIVVLAVLVALLAERATRPNA